MNNIHDISEDEACPNLIPAYSIDSPQNVKDKLNHISESEKDLHGSKLSALQNDSIPVLQRDICERMDSSMFNHYNKIKLESSEAMASNHVSI